MELLNKYIPRIDDDDLWMVLPMIATTQGLSEDISEPCRLRMQQWVRKEEGGPDALTVKLSAIIPWMAEAARERASTLTAEDIAKVKGDPGSVLRDRILDIYCSVTNWTDANKTAETIVLPNLLTFREEDVLRVVDAAGEGKADLRGSFGFNSFLKRSVESKIISKRALNSRLKKHKMSTL